MRYTHAGNVGRRSNFGIGGVKKVELWTLLMRTPESMIRILAVDLVSADAEKGGARI